MIFLVFRIFFRIFSGYFLDFWIFRKFGFLDLKKKLDFFLFLPKLLRLQLIVTKVNTGHQKLPKMGQMA